MKPGRQRQWSSLAPRPSQLAEDELLKHIYGASISEHVCRLIAALKTDHGSLDLTGLAITAPAPPNLLHSSSSSLLTNCSAGDSINALVFATVHHSKDKQLPYIRVGDKFMLFTHPNKHLPIFSDASSKNHASSSNPNNSSLSPSTSSAQTHLFDLVQSAYFTMKSRHQDQSIILR